MKKQHTRNASIAALKLRGEEFRKTLREIINEQKQINKEDDSNETYETMRNQIYDAELKVARKKNTKNIK